MLCTILQLTRYSSRAGVYKALSAWKNTFLLDFPISIGKNSDRSRTLLLVFAMQYATRKVCRQWKKFSGTQSQYDFTEFLELIFRIVQTYKKY